jgi:hypothetical protein
MIEVSIAITFITLFVTYSVFVLKAPLYSHTSLIHPNWRLRESNDF